MIRDGLQRTLSVFFFRIPDGEGFLAAALTAALTSPRGVGTSVR